ncbi:MAG: hypothetical protein Q9166_000978 [cf. Caloplaca sp. 2 TL-2023]
MDIQLMPQTSPHLHGQSSLVASVEVGRRELKRLIPEGAESTGYRYHLKGSLIDFRSCELVWQVVQCHARIIGPDPIVKKNEISSALKRLTENAPNADSSISKPLKSPAYRPEDRVSRTGHRQADGNSIALVRANLRVSKEDQLRYVNRYDHKVGVAPRAGPLRCPIPVGARDILTLADREWLNDTIIDAYLCLVCHHGNGHFQLGPDVVQQDGSPTWHAWPLSFFLRKGTGALWPPAMYDLARPQDVKHHFFPVHSKDHWVLFHVYIHEAEWRADFYSSLSGYDHEIHKQWPYICKEMLTLSYGNFDLSSVQPRIPQPQPRQSNSNDCGVFLLCVARWTLEGWGLNTLLPEDCPDHRVRMIAEVERWHLG